MKVTVTNWAVMLEGKCIGFLATVNEETARKACSGWLAEHPEVKPEDLSFEVDYSYEVETENMRPEYKKAMGIKDRELPDEEFLQEATLLLHECWTAAGGRKLDSDELQDLNNLLEGFFSTWGLSDAG